MIIHFVTALFSFYIKLSSGNFKDDGDVAFHFGITGVYGCRRFHVVAGGGFEGHQAVRDDIHAVFVDGDDVHDGASEG